MHCGTSLRDWPVASRYHSRVSGRLTGIVLDCRRAAPLARFWVDALGWAVRPYDAAEVARMAALGYTPEIDPSVAVDAPDGSVTLWCQEVPEPRTVKNRMHLDLRGESPERLVALGASVREHHADHTVMADPEATSSACTGNARPAATAVRGWYVPGLT